jgi:redox-sensitive bicupin YhaK (pirin superfamily)
MLKIRRSQERGHADHGWLEAYHTFSFADYFDPEHMGYRVLRVINEDRVEPAQGFGWHGHRDMEILTWVLEGSLEHKDSMGSGGVIQPGEMQYMSAGKGVMHSEFNASREERLHLLQIWIQPSVSSAEPRYDQKSFEAALESGELVRVASPDGRDGSMAIRQDATLEVARLRAGGSVRRELGKSRHAWLQVARGGVRIEGKDLGQGDGASFEGGGTLEISAKDASEILLFDLP